VDLNSVIKAGGWNSRRPFSGRSLLVVSQTMLGVTLLSSAGLLALSFARAQEASPGFDTDRNILLMMASLSGPAGRRAATGDEIAAKAKESRPTAIVARTTKGWGAKSLQGGAWSGRIPNGDKLKAALEELRRRSHLGGNK
jgi:hypothetical protein